MNRIRRALGCLVDLVLFVGMLVVSLFHDWETDETLSWKVQEKRRDE